jgi:hypothetical protein
MIQDAAFGIEIHAGQQSVSIVFYDIDPIQAVDLV